MSEEAWLRDELARSAEQVEALQTAARARQRDRAEVLERLIDAHESERRRVARHLHDELAQTLTGLLMSLDASEVVMGDVPPVVREQLARTREIAARALEQTRSLILDLRPTMLDDLGLVPALRWYARDRLGPTGAVVSVRVRGEGRRLDQRMETCLFRIAQEAINNAARHARADRVGVLLRFGQGSVRLSVTDDGLGFDPETASRVRPTGQGLGLLGIRERAEMVGGSAVVRSRPGEGTRIEAVLPIGAENAGEPT